jgi:DNA polymerase III epsilon subunit-like protein
MDTETTGLSLDDDIWEFAAIRREDDGTETEHHLFIRHDAKKCGALPESFWKDHLTRYDAEQAVSPEDAAAYLEPLLNDGRPHVVGAVPNFDTERLALLLRAHGFEPRWHHHLIDVENLAVGYLAAKYAGVSLALPPEARPPWDSNVLSKAVGVDPADFARHTAMGDVLWARAIFDRVMGGAA